MQLPLGRKVELILLYFGVRKCSTHLVSLGFFCTLVPLTVFTPEVSWRSVRSGAGAAGGPRPMAHGVAAPWQQCASRLRPAHLAS